MKSIPTFGSSLTDLELWRCAEVQIEQYGEDALNAAARRMAELEAEDDWKGYAAWAGIVLRVALLGPPSATSDDVVRH